MYNKVLIKITSGSYVHLTSITCWHDSVGLLPRLFKGLVTRYLLYILLQKVIVYKEATMQRLANKIHLSYVGLP